MRQISAAIVLDQMPTHQTTLKMHQPAKPLGLLACAATWIAFVAGCSPARPNVVEPETSHFWDDAGRPLPEYESIWKGLEQTYAESMPARVVIRFDDGDRGYFDSGSSEVRLSRSLFANHPAMLLAHETSHLCLAILTDGASGEEAFRFLDEGFAEIVSRQVTGGLDEYKGLALSEARIQQSKGNVTFEKVQGWSSYFGNWRGGPANGSTYAHPVGASFDFMILDRYGQATLLELFRTVGRTRSLEASTEVVLHKKLAELQEEWLAYLAAVPIPAVPRVVELFPETGAAAVPTELSELRVVFDLPMRDRIGISSSCEPDVSYRNASWRDRQTLIIRLPNGLPSKHTCHLQLGTEHVHFQSRPGAELPVVDWTFTAR